MSKEGDDVTPMNVDAVDEKENKPGSKSDMVIDSGNGACIADSASQSRQIADPPGAPPSQLKRKESPDGDRHNPKTKLAKRSNKDKVAILKRRIKRHRQSGMHGCGRARCLLDNCCADRPNANRLTEAEASKAAIDCIKNNKKLCEDFSSCPLTVDFVRQEYKEHQNRVEAGLLKASDPEAEGPGPEDDTELINALVSAFAHLEGSQTGQAILDGSFKLLSDRGPTPDSANMNLDLLEDFSNEILVVDQHEGNLVGVFGSEFKRRQGALRDALEGLKKKKRVDLTYDELLLLRRVFVLFNCGIFITMDPGVYDTTMWPAVSLLNFCIDLNPDKINAIMEQIIMWGIDAWSKDRIINLRDTLQQYITIRWEEIFESERIERIVLDSSMNDTIGPAIRVLDLVHRVAYHPTRRDKIDIPDEDWYNEPISTEFAKGTGVANYDYKRWCKKSEIAIAHYPFMLDAGSKAQILLTDSKFQQRESTDRQMRRAIFDRMLSMAPGQDMRGSLRQLKMMPYLLLQVSRENIVTDALTTLLMQDAHSYKKPLKVKFKGEEGIDEGGVRKEFFQLIIREIFNPMRGIFTLNEETREFWFNRDSLESDQEYELIGILCGLSIYNSVILDIRWPSLVFRKLKDIPMSRDDFREFDPAQMKNFDKLLEMSDADLQALDIRFEYSYTFMDQEKVIELKTNGSEIVVGKHNNEDYVQRYIDFVLNKSIEQQFNEFKRGFELVCQGPALNLFKWRELELLVCGSPEFDFEALEGACHYQDGYSKESSVVKWLWEILHSLEEDVKRKFLEFATGSDRVPIRGLGALRLVITKAGGDLNQLPTSHTCFNHLLLPEYKSKDELKTRLLKAMEYCKGFGLK